MGRVIALQQTLLTCPPTPTQRAAARLLAGGRAEMEAIRATFARRRDAVAQTLAAAEIPHAPMDGAFYAWADVSACGGGRSFARALLEQDGVIVIPGEAFGASCADWIRISYAQEDAVLAGALDRLVQRYAAASR